MGLHIHTDWLQADGRLSSLLLTSAVHETDGNYERCFVKRSEVDVDIGFYMTHHSGWMVHSALLGAGRTCLVAGWHLYRHATFIVQVLCPQNFRKWGTLLVVIAVVRCHLSTSLSGPSVLPTNLV